MSPIIHTGSQDALDEMLGDVFIPAVDTGHNANFGVDDPNRLGDVLHFGQDADWAEDFRVAKNIIFPYPLDQRKRDIIPFVGQSFWNGNLMTNHRTLPRRCSNQAQHPRLLLCGNQRWQGITAWGSIGFSDLGGGAIPEDNSLALFQNSGNKGLVDLGIAENFLNRRTPLPSRDCLAVDEVLSSARDVRFGVNVKNIDAAYFLHHPLPEAAGGGIHSVPDELTAGERQTLDSRM